jgi:hypothetical protein
MPFSYTGWRKMSGTLSRRDFLKSGFNLAGAISIGRVVDLSLFSNPGVVENSLPSAAADIGTNDHSVSNFIHIIQES